MVIRIKKVDYDSIVALPAFRWASNESCGLIAGFADGDVKHEKVYFH